MTNETNYKALVEQGALIVDVRTEEEFKGGHVNGSVNIVLDTVPNNLDKFGDTNGQIILCCRSGGRAGVAQMILQKAGFVHVHNAGGWDTLAKALA